MEQAGESQLDGKNPPAPIPRTRPSRVCAQETGERSRRQNRSAGMDVGGFWILALFEFFFRQALDMYRKEGRNVLSVSLFFLTT